MALLAQGSWQGNKFILPVLPEQPSLLRPHTPAVAEVGSGPVFQGGLLFPNRATNSGTGGGEIGGGFGGAPSVAGPSSGSRSGPANAGPGPGIAGGRVGGVIGSVASLASGVPGLGTLGSGIGAAIGAANMNEAANALGFAGIQANPALSAFNSMTMGLPGMFGYDLTPQGQMAGQIAAQYGYEPAVAQGVADAIGADFGGFDLGNDMGGYGDLGTADMGFSFDAPADFASAALSDMAASNSEAPDSGLTAGGNVSGFGSGGEKGEGASSSTGSVGIGESGGGSGAGGAGGSVICTALYVDGRLDKKLWVSSRKYGQALDHEVYQGYLLWGARIAKNKTIVRKLERLGGEWAKEMAFRIGDRDQGSNIGAAILAVCIPFSRLVYKANKWYSLASNAIKSRKLGLVSRG